MRVATVSLKSISPYSQSRAHEAEKLNRETADEYEKRTWREKCHYTPKGHVRIPGMSFKQGLDTASKMLGLQIPGKGRATYSKFFTSGVLCIDDLQLPEKVEDVRAERVHCHANGKRGSGSRVWRYFPMIDRWSGVVPFHVLADEITNDVFEQTLRQAGNFVGIGRFRPENGGTLGRYTVEKIAWATV